jgi:hypothetical protein
MANDRILEVVAMALASADQHAPRGVALTQWGDVPPDGPGSLYREAWRKDARELLALLSRVGLKVTESRPQEQAAAHDVEAIAAKVHDNWMAAKLAAGVMSRKLESGEELMVPYEQLSEQAKDLDRGTVRAVLAAMPQEQAAGGGWVPKAGDSVAKVNSYPDIRGKVVKVERIAYVDWATGYRSSHTTDEIAPLPSPPSDPKETK